MQGELLARYGVLSFYYSKNWAYFRQQPLFVVFSPLSVWPI